MLRDLIQKYIEEEKIPGGVIHVQRHKEILYRDSFGSFITRNNERKPVTFSTLFDIASLTKVVATLPAFLVLLDRKQLSLKDPVQKYISQFCYSDINIEHLLYHNSGLPADLFPPVQRDEKRNILEEILTVVPLFKPEKEVVYSDLGMILLGKIIEEVSGEVFDTFVAKEVLTPMGMHQTIFNPKGEIRNLIATTEKINDCFIQGEVHDEKAFLLNGVSGSAGLFSCLDDLVHYAQYWLNISEQSVFDPVWLQNCHQNTFKHRGLGFEVWNGIDTEVTINSNWSIGSFGHTGFTGTSVWMDPKEELFVVLLTNAIHYGRDAPKKEFRQAIHKSVYDMYIKKGAYKNETMD
ncbi:beta-lactamase family protein [Psychrobacillus sp. Sa2BUA9]|uniref:Beta-lactamase family protein n=1 Tax=Psychrobacillus faecigallinarum TaxID=2762235 RepID=A0ABR8RAB5_9BACI|nr:serine hydrolase domain-containing protein [Psychrobacillus faecigallinarum]MBD7944630.1 beta-lactamase family protein [Psychrobacillus faecigallinarum]